MNCRKATVVRPGANPYPFEHKIGIFVLFLPSKPPFSGVSSTKSRFLCQKGQFFPGFTPFRAQNRVFCVKMGDFSEILGCFDTKSAFLCSWMAAASPAVPAEAQQGPPELSTARHVPCGVHLAAVRPAIDCCRRPRCCLGHPPPHRAPTTWPGRNVIAETFIIYGTFVSKNLVSWRPQLEARGRLQKPNSKNQISKQIVINEKDSIYGSCNDLCSRLQKWRWGERG